MLIYFFRMGKEWIFSREIVVKEDKKKRRVVQFVYAWVPDPAMPKVRSQRRLPKSITSKKNAVKYVQQHRGSLQSSSIATVKRGPTVAELAVRWIDHREADERLARATVKDNVSHVNRHIVPSLGGLEVALLEDGVALRKFIRALRKDVAAFTCRNVWATLKVFFDDVIAEHWARIRVNPARLREVKAELPEAVPCAGESHKIRIYDVETGQKLISSESVPDERRVRYAVALTSGARDGELAGAAWRSVMLGRVVGYPRLTIQQALQFKGPGGYATLGKTKTRQSVREVPLHRAAVAALTWWWETGWERFCERRPTLADPVFVSARGKAWRPNSAAHLRRDLEAIGAPSHVDGHAITFHALRRSFSTWMNASGVPKEARDYLLGHQAKSTGERCYTASDVGQLAEFVNRIGLEWTRLRSR